jgi:hypothetical protein
MTNSIPPPPAQVCFVVTLKGAAGGDSANTRALRFLLKSVLRDRSLRCTDVRQVDDCHLHHNDDGDKR